MMLQPPNALPRGHPLVRRPKPGGGPGAPPLRAGYNRRLPQLWCGAGKGRGEGEEGACFRAGCVAVRRVGVEGFRVLCCALPQLRGSPAAASILKEFRAGFCSMSGAEGLQPLTQACYTNLAESAQVHSLGPEVAAGSTSSCLVAGSEVLLLSLGLRTRANAAKGPGRGLAP